MHSMTVQMELPGVQPSQGDNAKGVVLATAVSEFAGLRHGNLNKIALDDHAAHNWYRFVLSYPPHLVREYVKRFGVGDHDTVLDPFCGTGTTTTECKKMGVQSIGVEAHPFSAFASGVKVNWDVQPDELARTASKIAETALRQLHRDGIEDLTSQPNPRHATRTLPESQLKLLLANSISALPMHKTLVLLDAIEKYEKQSMPHLRLCLAKILVYSIGNLHFGPEVGVGKPKIDSPVIATWLSEVHKVVNDLRVLCECDPVSTSIIHGDSRLASDTRIAPGSISAVITSPPYPNEKDYTRTTRLESVILGFVTSKQQLRALKKTFVRSNTRSVYKQDDDERWVSRHASITRIAEQIEKRRIELKKTSGFERLYHRVTKLYFGGMARHLEQLRTILRPGAQLAYVVGDQASYLRVMIRTGELLAEVAEELGYEVVGIDLFRTRLSTATRQQLREEVVILRWPGARG